MSTIANLATKDGVIAFAGINSSEKDRQNGKNEHLRSFEVKYPPRKRQRISKENEEEKIKDTEQHGQITFLAKTALFKPTAHTPSETYQRVMRLSPVVRRDVPNKRIGVIASDLAPDNEEIVVFNATTSNPRDSDVISRMPLPKTDRAMDIDIQELEERCFRVAYCTNYSVYLKELSYDFALKKGATGNENTRVYSLPMSNQRPKLRSLRFLTEEFILILADLPGRGAELSILRLHGSTNGSVTLRKTLSTKAVGFDVCPLDADLSTGDRQFVVAIGGSDNSIQIFTLDLDARKRALSTFRKFTTVKDVHPIYITRVCFEPFHGPVRTPQAPATNSSATPNSPNPVPLNALPQYIRLASTSAANQVVVDTFPLSPVTPTSRDSRYILSSPSSLSSLTPYLVLAFTLAICSLLMQSVLDAQGALEPGSSVLSFLPPGARHNVEQALDPAASLISQLNIAGLKARLLPESTEHAAQDSIPEKPRLKHLVEKASSSAGPSESQAVVVYEHAPEELSLDIHPDVQAYLASEPGAAAKRWEELEPHQQAAWKEKLVKAGHWALEEGDTVLKGILFSEWAGFIGEMAGEAMQS